MADRLTLEFVIDKETKGTRRFAEQGDDPAVGSITSKSDIQVRAQ
jgi:hypothetical protein